MDTIDNPPLDSCVNVQTSAWMPIDVNRIKGSVFVAESTAEEFRAAVHLWCSSWHQVPASSLPDNNVTLANLAGFGRDVDGWDKVKVKALYGFKKCKSDGRLYHPLIAEKAIVAYRERKEAYEQARLAGKKSGEARRKQRDELQGKLFETNASSNASSNENDGPLNQVDLSEVDLSEVNPIERKTKKESAQVAVMLGIWFNRFWNQYPHKVQKGGKYGGKAAFHKAISSGASIDVIMAGLERYITGKPADRPWCNPATWLNGERWNDVPAGNGGTAKPVQVIGEPAKPAYALPTHGEIVTESMCPTVTMRQHIGKVFVRHDSPEWHAWASFYSDEDRAAGRRYRTLNATLAEKGGAPGWTFPARWPPNRQQ